MFTSAEVAKRLKQESAVIGSQLELAKKIGISPAYLSEIIRGNREPFGKVLKYLKLKRVTGYLTKS